MNSGNLERVTKLWISVWTLILENKRHLESVLTSLQQIVFSQMGWPRFKNWPAICKLGAEDKLMMFVVATLDMSKVDTSDVVQRIIASFPECFSPEKVRGPIPWSVLKNRTIHVATIECRAEYNGNDQAWLRMDTHGTLEEFSIPRQQFAIFPEAVEKDVLPLPPEIGGEISVGSKVQWQGHEWIVVENQNHDGFLEVAIFIAPAECIDMTS